jgi:PAS domain S-box-containing protein
MHDRYLDILDHLRAMVAEVDGEGRITYLSPNAADLLGYTPDELLAKSGFELVHEEDLDRVRALSARTLADGQPARIAYRARHKAGHWVWLECSGRFYRSADGSPRAVVFATDASERIRVDAALRESEARFESLASNATDLLMELDASGRYLYVSPSCAPILGIPPQALLGRTMRDPLISRNIHPDDRERVMRRFAARATEGGIGSELYRYCRADGSWCWFENRTRSYRAADGSIRVAVVARDVTERVRAEEELRESEERYRVVTEATSDLVSELDGEGRLVYASAALKDVLGYAPEELVGTTPLALLLSPDDAERAAQSFLDGFEKAGPARTAPYRMRRRDGTWRWFESTGVPYRKASGEVRMIAVTRDISDRVRAEEERRDLEARMQQTQKLESLGIMAGGIAHDFNNLLTPILGDASLALMDLPAESPLRDRMERIQKAAHRAAALTNQMLAYAGKRPLLVETVNLSRLALEMARLLETAVTSNAVLAFEMAADLPPVEGDVSQLSQVVMNLVINASEAIGDGRGRIDVRTGAVEARHVARRTALFGSDLRDGSCVYFEVQDDGCGMDERTRARIFDPFFTTKFTGRGLGLAAVMGIVRGHHGALEIESEPGRGTRFRVIFPAAADAPLRRLPRDAPPWQAQGTLLVVDDDDDVRELVSETLGRAGLSVVEARDGREALRIFRHHPEQFDAVLLDRTLPRTSGDEVFDTLRAIRPDVRVLLMSGYGEDVAAVPFAGKDLAAFLQKPFLPSTLLERVRAVLER